MTLRSSFRPEGLRIRGYVRPLKPGGLKGYFEGEKMRFFWYRELSLREKACLALLCLAGNSLGSIFLAQDISRFFVIAFLAGGIGFGRYLVSLRCPKCGTPIMKNELHVFGFNTHMWKPFPVKHCSKCGKDITKCDEGCPQGA